MLVRYYTGISSYWYDSVLVRSVKSVRSIKSIRSVRLVRSVRPSKVSKGDNTRLLWGDLEWRTLGRSCSQERVRALLTSRVEGSAATCWLGLSQGGRG